MLTVPFAPVAIPWEVTVIMPPPAEPGVDEVVSTLLTYLVPEPDAISQPHPPAAIVAPEDDVEMLSVMLVRQAEAAKMTSVILARAV